MNFLRSVFSDSPPQSPSSPNPNRNPNPNSPTSSSDWTLSSLLDSYSRDISDFSSAFRHDTSFISRSLLPLPLSLDDAQHSLESVGQAIDDLGSLLLSRGKLALSGLDRDSAPPGIAGTGLSGEKYSRYAAQLSAIQGDAGTYLEDPDDEAGFANWKLGFVIEDRREEIEGLLRGNGVVRGIYESIVPSEVEGEVFWERYFYRVYKLDKVEDARARLVRRAMAGKDEEDDLRWDFEDDDDKDDDCKIGGGNKIDGRSSTSEAVESDRGKSEEKEAKAAEKDSGGDSSCKDSDLSIISSQPSMPEVEDLGWDEIEDVIDDDHEKNKIKPADGGVSRTRKDEPRNQLIPAAEDDDLSWDIEDEDDSRKP